MVLLDATSLFQGVPAVILVVLGTLIFFTVTGQWAFWLVVSLLVTSFRFLIAVYQVFRIIISLVALMAIRIFKWSRDIVDYVQCMRRGTAQMRASITRASTYESWVRRVKRLEDLEGITLWRNASAEDMQKERTGVGKVRKVEFQTIQMVTERMMRDLVTVSGDQSEKVRSLSHSLPGFVTRNFANSDSRLLHSTSLLGTNYIMKTFARPCSLRAIA